VFRASLIVAGIWISIILNVAINVGVNGASKFYTPTGYCEFPKFPSPNPESKRVTFYSYYQRVLDIGGISCPKDSCRLHVDVDLGLLEFAGLCSRLSRAGRFC
jgi:hypothetical protein